MKYETTITSKGTITIAAPIRKALGLKPGQKVRLELDKDERRVLMDAGVSAQKFEAARLRLISKIPKRKLGLSGLALREAIEKAKKVDAKNRYLK